jgi:hypothetical protein
LEFVHVDELVFGELAIQFHHRPVLVLERVLGVGYPGI